MGPGTLGLAAVQINLLVNTVLATGEGTGAVSWLSYAFRLMYLPIGLFGVSIATAVLPALSQQAARGAPDAMRQTVSSALRLMLILNVPATIGLVVLATPIVALIFERGSSRRPTPPRPPPRSSATLPGLLGYSAVKIVVPSFYALGDSRTPALTQRRNRWRSTWRSISCSSGSSATGVWPWARRSPPSSTRRRWCTSYGAASGDWRTDALVTALTKIGVAATCMGLAAGATERWWASLWPTPEVVGQTIRLGSAIVVGLVVLAGAARVLRIEEFAEARRRILTRFFSPANT